jgi:tRNA 2-selenouridine synthase
MKEEMAIQDLIARGHQWQIIDVRSPGEFKDGHIPGAFNIPLFSDEERAKVGTAYKQGSPDSAFELGLDIAGGKMSSFLKSIKSIKSNPDQEFLVHCWRGGKRSQAMQWLFTFSGTKTYRLEGGYKSYRSAIQDYFKQTFQFKIIGGCTGSGKTEILQSLAANGEQVIDLEHLANHKGSAFGSIGEMEQPSTEQFENNLFSELQSLDPERPIWLENESKNIGRVYIPEAIWRQMRNSVLYTIDVDPEIRLDRSMRYYSEPIDVDMLKASFEKIRKRLGGLDYQMAIQALDKSDLRKAARIALQYYDKSYTFQLGNWPVNHVIRLAGCNDVQETAERLVKL